MTDSFPEPKPIDRWANLQPPPREWVIDRLIPAGEVTLLSGDGGLGKSTIAAQLALAVSTARKWFDMPAEAGPVLAIFAEDDENEEGRRFHLIAAGDGTDLSDAKNLNAFNRDDFKQSGPIMASVSNGVVQPTPFFHHIYQLTCRIKPKLIILDPLAELFTGNENIRAEAAAFVRLVASLTRPSGAAVLILSHPSLAGINSGSGSSGSTGWNAAVRSRLYLTAPDLRKAPAIRHLQLMKANYAPTGAGIDMRYEDGRFVLIAPVTTDARLAREGEIDLIFLKLLEQLQREGRPPSPAKSNNYAPTIFAELPAANGFSKGEFSHAMDRLLANGSIRVEEEGPPSRRRKRLVAVHSNASTNAPTDTVPTPTDWPSHTPPITPMTVGTVGRVGTPTGPTASYARAAHA